MARLLSPDGACVGVDVGAGSYNGTVLEVTNRSHERALRAAGYTSGDIAGGPARTAGRQCEGCGFLSYFVTCSRCGGHCAKL